MFTSLKAYTDALEKKGGLVRIKEQTDPQLDIPRISAEESQKSDGGKVLLFENTGTRFPVLANMVNTEEKFLSALGLGSFDELTAGFSELKKSVLGCASGLVDRLRLVPDFLKWTALLPREHKGHATSHDSVQYVAHLEHIPVPGFSTSDAARTLTTAMVHTISPLTGERNVDICKVHIINENTASIQWPAGSPFARHLAECTHRLPVAVALGGDPLYSFAAAAPLPEWLDPYIFAGLVREKPVSLAACFTQDLSVPADCDFVFEGYVQKSEARLADDCCALHISCITHRRDAVCPASPDMTSPYSEEPVREACTRVFLALTAPSLAPEIEDMYIPDADMHKVVVKLHSGCDYMRERVENALRGTRWLMKASEIVFEETIKK